MGEGATGYELFRAVDDILVAVQDSPRLYGSSVTAGLGFCQSISADPFTAGQRRQKFMLLFLGAKGYQAVAAQGIVHGQDRSCGGTGFGNLLYDNDIADRIGINAFILFGYDQAHEAQFSHFLEIGQGRFTFLIQLCGHRSQFVLGKVSRHLTDHLLLFVEL
jgi:hypothetical protein